ncbi:Ig-like domain-containing protein [Brevibacillus agri]|uniref:Ig-like domain-containing protein n=1 Tax=Brevibacillus agri TaxID=51101 RepID=UPI002E24BE66|nr:Ig-like domain-containing protein [Brevibacillus agri]
MNKKVALSLLSATVFASMAASAFAAPKSGVYMGGDVDRYYALTDLFKLNDAGYAKFQSDLAKTKFENLIFVDHDGKGASLKEILSSTQDFEKIKRDLKQNDFEGEYAKSNLDGTNGESYDPRKDITPEPTGDLKVESVSAINAKTLVIKFGTAVDFDTVIDDQDTASTSDDTLKTTAVEISELDGQSPITEANMSASLSEDGKTLTLVADGSEYFEGRYAVKVTDAVTDEDGNQFEIYTTTVNVKDTTRPTITKLNYVDNETVRIYFSEPVDVKGTVNYKRADGKALNGGSVISESLAADGSYLEVDLSTLNSADHNTDINVEIIGAKDFAGNLISPNPVTKTVKYSTADTIPPTVASLTVMSNKKVKIQFSEELKQDPVITIGGNATTVTKDAVDPTVYYATLASATSGLKAVAMPANTGYIDKAGNAGAAYSKIVNFDVDTDAPVFQSATIEKISGVEYLVVRYNENVTPGDAKVVSGYYVKDSVTSPTSPVITTDADKTGAPDNFTLYKPVSGKSTAVKLDLSSITQDGDYTVTLPEGFVADLNGNDSAEKTEVKFKRTTDTVTGKVEINTGVTAEANEVSPLVGGNGIEVVLTAPNKFLVHFDRKVDPASALNKANYKVEGATVSGVKLTANGATLATVEVTIADGSSTFSGEREIEISGVKSEGLVVMDAYKTTEYISETVRPTITKAELTGNTTDAEITLTFSENIQSDTIQEAGSQVADFLVYIGGVKYTGTVAEASTGNGKTATLTLTGKEITAAELASGIVIKPASGMDVTDKVVAPYTAGNKLDFTSIEVQ